MARFCTECGKEIEEGVAFCTECGTKITVDAAPVIAEVAQPTAQTTPAVQPQPEYVQPTYIPPAPPPAPAPAPKASAVIEDPKNKVVGTGAYFGLVLLFSIPVVGFIASIIMSFAPKNKNLKNYARAMLIWSAIGLVIAGLLYALFSILTNSVMDYINQFTDGQSTNFGDIFSQFSNY